MCPPGRVPRRQAAPRPDLSCKQCLDPVPPSVTQLALLECKALTEGLKSKKWRFCRLGLISRITLFRNPLFYQRKFLDVIQGRDLTACIRHLMVVKWGLTQVSWLGCWPASPCCALSPFILPKRRRLDFFRPRFGTKQRAEVSQGFPWPGVRRPDRQTLCFAEI